MFNESSTQGHGGTIQISVLTGYPPAKTYVNGYSGNTIASNTRIPAKILALSTISRFSAFLTMNTISHFAGLTCSHQVILS